MFATPEPSSTSLPRRVMAVTSNKACFAIGDQQSNDAILGTGSYNAGISAVGLVPTTEEGPATSAPAWRAASSPSPACCAASTWQPRRSPGRRACAGAAREGRRHLDAGGGCRAAA